MSMLALEQGISLSLSLPLSLFIYLSPSLSHSLFVQFGFHLHLKLLSFIIFALKRNDLLQVLVCEQSKIYGIYMYMGVCVCVTVSDCRHVT